MKKMIFLFIISFSLCIQFFSQTEKENYLGFKGGVSIPQLSSNDSNELSRMDREKIKKSPNNSNVYR